MTDSTKLERGKGSSGHQRFPGAAPLPQHNWYPSVHSSSPAQPPKRSPSIVLIQKLLGRKASESSESMDQPPTLSIPLSIKDQISIKRKRYNFYEAVEASTHASPLPWEGLPTSNLQETVWMLRTREGRCARKTTEAPIHPAPHLPAAMSVTNDASAYGLPHQRYRHCWGLTSKAFLTGSP